MTKLPIFTYCRLIGIFMITVMLILGQGINSGLTKADAAPNYNPDPKKETQERLKKEWQQREKQEKGQQLVGLYQSLFPGRSERILASMKKAEAMMRRGQYTEAIAQYTTVINKYPKDENVPLALCGRADALTAQGNYEVALADYNQSLLLSPQNYDAFLGRGIVYAMTNRPQQSLDDLTSAIKLMEYVLTALKEGLFEALSAQQQTELEIQHIELGRKQSRAYFIRGQVQSNLNLLNEAVKDFDNSVAMTARIINYDHSDTFMKRGGVLHKLQKYPEAVKDFTAVIERNPNNNFAYFQRAEAYRLNGELDKAVMDFTLLIDRNADKEFYAYRGECYRMQNQSALAFNDLNTALAFAPDSVFALHVRGELYRSMGQYDLAIADFDHALRIDPGQQQIQERRKLALFQKNNG